MSKNSSGQIDVASSGNTGTVLSTGDPSGLRPAPAELPLGWVADPSRLARRRFGRPTELGAFAGVRRRRRFEEDGRHGPAVSVTAGEATAAANARRADRRGVKEPREAAAAAMRAERRGVTNDLAAPAPATAESPRQVDERRLPMAVWK